MPTCGCPVPRSIASWLPSRATRAAPVGKSWDTCPVLLMFHDDPGPPGTRGAPGGEALGPPPRAVDFPRRPRPAGPPAGPPGGDRLDPGEDRGDDLEPLQGDRRGGHVRVLPPVLQLAAVELGQLDGLI